jgi:hypothetical protein
MPELATARRYLRTGLATILMMVAFSAVGEDYMGRDEFLVMAFGDSESQMETLWLTKETKAAAQAAVGWTPAALRLRYWRSGERSAWILEEIGKDQPITMGVVVVDDKIERLEVLAFRESRGWEIRYPFFTGQFGGLTLAQDGHLSESIDGITGATLSVRATEHVARRALWLHGQVQR